MNYSPLNVFSSLFTSVNIYFLCCRSSSVNEESKKLVLGWTSFFPSFLLNDMIWRDPFGICLISIGVVLISLSNSAIEKVLFLSL